MNKPPIDTQIMGVGTEVVESDVCPGKTTGLQTREQAIFFLVAERIIQYLGIK